MNKNVMIVLVGGFIIAILVAVLVQASLGGKTESDTGPKTEVLVAAKDLPIGADIAPGDLKWQTWPGEAFDGAVIRKENEEADKAATGRVIQRVSAGQPFLLSYVFKEGKGNVVAATLEKGMRAIAVPVDANTMAGGFVSPGDNVDVILTYKVEIDDDDKSTETKEFIKEQASETILKNIKVLAVDQEASREEDAAKIARTVTLAVSQEAAEKLALGMQMGELTLVLRGIGDDTDMDPGAVTTDIDVSRTLKKVSDIRRDQENAKPVRIYNGAVMQQINPRSQPREESGERFQEERGDAARGPVLTAPNTGASQ